MKLSLLYEAIRKGFKLSKFKSMNRDTMLMYAKGYLTSLGSGSSRDVFLYGSKKALKIANDVLAYEYGGGTVGRKQNEAEVAAWTMPGMKPIIAAVYDYDHDYDWIISELVNPVKNIDQVNKYFGSKIFDSNDEFNYFFYLIANDEDPSADISKWVADYKFTENSKIKFLKFVNMVLEYAKMVGTVGDLDRIGHYGFTADGRLVILDYGLNASVQKEFY